MLSSAEAIAATHARVCEPEALPRDVRVSTDTRIIEPGEMYLALRGPAFDGHDFVADALTKGAAGVIVARADVVPPGAAALVVDDTLRAYMALGRAAREHFTGVVLAITGSSGKTTTKSLAVQLLEGAGMRVASTPQNENNEIGVSKFLLALDREPVAPDVAVIEMGARHPGDIATLVEIARPTHGILTNVGEAHLEIFGSRDNLAETKWGLFSGGAHAILNLGDRASLARSDRLPGADWYGFGTAVSARAGTNVLVRDRRRLEVVRNGNVRGFSIDARLPGDHNLTNLAAAFAGALAAGADIGALIAAIPELTLPSGRYEVVALPSGIRVVYDAYNASMSGTIATLRTFAAEPGVRRVAVLGGMAELGAESPQMHAQVGAEAARCGIDVLLVGGEFAGDLARGALEAGFDDAAIVPYKNNEAALAWLHANARSGDVILLKGSRMYRMEQILSGLKKAS